MKSILKAEKSAMISSQHSWIHVLDAHLEIIQRQLF